MLRVYLKEEQITEQWGTADDGAPELSYHPIPEIIDWIQEEGAGIVHMNMDEDGHYLDFDDNTCALQFKIVWG